MREKGSSPHRVMATACTSTSDDAVLLLSACAGQLLSALTSCSSQASHHMTERLKLVPSQQMK
jgi:hypothetical protein